MDVRKINLGSPRLLGGGYLFLHEATEHSGIDADDLLQKASEGRLSIAVHFGGLWGHAVARQAVEADPDAFAADHCPIPVQSEHCFHVGTLVPQRPREVAGMLLTESTAPAKVFAFVAGGDFVFIAEQMTMLTRSNILVRAADVEAIRVTVKAKLTKDQLKASRTPAPAKAAKGTTGPLSSFLDGYMQSRPIKPDEARRIRSLLELFIEKTGDPDWPSEVNNTLVDGFEEWLRLVPDHEEKVRLRLRTSTVQESIDALAGTDYKKLTEGSIDKRMAWLQAFITWVKSRGELRLKGRAKKQQGKPSEAREKVSDADLQALFSEAIFKTGGGVQTKRGTFFKFAPCHYLGPLIALHTGMRPNEQCQMLLSDVINIDGAWWFDIAEDDSEDTTIQKSLKTLNSRRRIPVHPLLIRLRLIEYRDRLQRDGHDRLFPEWSAHASHGRFSPKAGQWFNGNLRKRTLGSNVSPKRTLYSLRHNFGSALRESGCTDRIALALMGHSQGEAELHKRYDKPHESPQLVEAIYKLDFGLPEIAPFDIEAGVAALHDAIRRSQNKRQGSARAALRKSAAETTFPS